MSDIELSSKVFQSYVILFQLVRESFAPERTEKKQFRVCLFNK